MDDWEDVAGGDSGGHERALSAVQNDRMRETFEKTGFREGLEDGKHQFIQQGFDLGFEEAARLGYGVGRARGLAEAAAAIAELAAKGDTSAAVAEEAAAIKAQLEGLQPSQLTECEAKAAVAALERADGHGDGHAVDPPPPPTAERSLHGEQLAGLHQRAVQAVMTALG